MNHHLGAWGNPAAIPAAIRRGTQADPAIYTSYGTAESQAAMRARAPTIGGALGPLVAAVVPHPLLRPVAAALPGGDTRGLHGTWTDWLGSPAGIVTVGSALALAVSYAGPQLAKEG